MQVKGLTEAQIDKVLKSLDMVKRNGFSKKGRFLIFGAQPETARSKYARRSPDLRGFDGEIWHKGHRLKALCSHGWRDLIFALFDAGAIRVDTSQGRWENKEAFEYDLYDLFCVNVGSAIFPVEMRMLCEHEASHLEPITKPRNKFQKAKTRTDKSGNVSGTINQKDLDSTCWLVQMFGTDRCKDCDLLNTPNCGGSPKVKKYLKTNLAKA